ncbi:MAG: hypothetical protein IJ523_00940 [Succinivibrionaceae bacterium]|nr:hypothetical protein [Succinivibrionaceae bacterium]
MGQEEKIFPGAEKFRLNDRICSEIIRLILISAVRKIAGLKKLYAEFQSESDCGSVKQI